MPKVRFVALKLITLALFYIALISSPNVFAEPQKTLDKDKPQLIKSKSKKDDVNQWSDWDSPVLTKPKYGVGIQGEIESKLNQLDKSNLLDKANGVLVKKNNKAVDKMKKPKNIKQMMAELKAMEAELKQELSHESEF